MSIAPALSWQTNKLPKFKRYLFIFILISVLTFIISYYSFFNAWGFVGLFLSFIIIGSSLITMNNNYSKNGFKKFFIYNNALIAHIGVGIMILGITCSSVFQSEFNLTLALNEKIQVNEYTYELENTKIFDKKNYQELVGVFKIYKNKKLISEIKPSKRYYHVSKMITTEAGIYRHWLQDFYIVLGNEANNKWNIKIYHNPLVNFIWIGTILMIISGLIGIRK